MRLDAPAAVGPPARLPLVDALRGVAIVAMAIYHLSWDLRFFGFIAADVAGDLGWRIFARLIAGSFLALVGVSLVLSMRSGFDRGRYLKRLATIVAAATAITIVTRFVFPENYIFFGILHCIALASVVALPFVQAPLILVAAASAFSFLAPALLSGPAFDHPALLWLGLATYVPRSNDYVPLFPWFGAVLLGILAARIAPRSARAIPLGWRRVAPAPLAWAGRHSLAIYLIHQPLLFGLVFLAARISPPDAIGFESSYLQSCAASCVESEVEPSICERTCGCMLERSKAEDLWAGVARNELSDAQLSRYYEITDECRAAAEPE